MAPSLDILQEIHYMRSNKYMYVTCCESSLCVLSVQKLLIYKCRALGKLYVR